MNENPIKKLKRKLDEFEKKNVSKESSSSESSNSSDSSSSDDEIILNSAKISKQSKSNNTNTNISNNNKNTLNIDSNTKSSSSSSNNRNGTTKLLFKKDIKIEKISSSSDDSSSDSDDNDTKKLPTSKLPKSKKTGGKLFKKSFSSSDEELYSSSTDSDDSSSKVQSKTKDLISHIHQSNDESVTFKTTQVSKLEIENLLKNIKNDLREIKLSSCQQVYLINSLMRDEKLLFKRIIDVNLLNLDNDWFDFRPLFPFFFIPKYNNYNYLVSQLGLFRLTDNTRNISYNLNLNGLVVNFNNLVESNAYKYYGTYREQRPILALDAVTIFVKLTFLEIDFKTVVFEVIPHHTIHIKNNRVSDNSGKLLPNIVSASFSRSVHSNLFKQYLNSNTTYGIKVSFHVKSENVSEDQKGSLSLSWEDDGELSLVMNN